jgi:hypothetical protein
MKKIPITYTGSNTENLYVLGIRNGREVKLKVKEIGCHGPIKVDPFIHDNTSFPTYAELLTANNNGELNENTIYITEKDGKIVSYLFYGNRLISLSETNEPSTPSESGLTYAKSFNTFAELYEANKNSELDDKQIYTVTDKGSVEQYIIKDNKLVQVGNEINEITEGNSTNLSEKSDTPDVIGGIIDYNLPELVNGDYRYKNHTELTTVICDMPSLITGVQMFYGTGLTSFCGDLSSLENGIDMFTGCKLDENSIINIIDSIPDHFSDGKTHVLSIGRDTSVSEELISDLSAEASAKNWSILWS